MNRIERFYATIERKPVDRPASWLGLPDRKALDGLFKHFKVKNMEEFKAAVDDDIYPVELPYHSPTSNTIYAAFNFARKLHAVLIGNDFGSQTGLMLSPSLIREYVLDGTRQLVQQAKSYGLKVIHHSCGSIRQIIPDLIDTGADAIHPIQALAAGMDPYDLKKDFGDRVYTDRYPVRALKPRQSKRKYYTKCRLRSMGAGYSNPIIP